MQHARLPCPSPTPGAFSNSSPSSWWCHPTILSAVVPFSCLQSFPASVSTQIKTTRHHCTLVRMAIIKKSTNNKCWRRCGEKGILPHSWWACKLVQPLRRTVWSFLRKLKIYLPCDPAIPFGHTLREKSNSKDMCTQCSQQQPLQSCKTWKQSKCPLTDTCIKMLWCVCVTMEYYSVIKRMT